MKNVYVLAVLAVILSACSSVPVGVPDGYSGGLASVKGSLAGFTDFMSGGAAHCQIQSVDGVSHLRGAKLVPGRHRIGLYLSNMGQEFTGELELEIPEARQYLLRARRLKDEFTIQFVDMERETVISEHSATVNQRMMLYFSPIQK